MRKIARKIAKDASKESGELVMVEQWDSKEGSGMKKNMRQECAKSKGCKEVARI